MTSRSSRLGTSFWRVNGDNRSIHTRRKSQTVPLEPPEHQTKAPCLIQVSPISRQWNLCPDRDFAVVNDFLYDAEEIVQRVPWQRFQGLKSWF